MRGHGHGGAGTGPAFLGRERPPVHDRHTEHVEEAGGHEAGERAPRVA
jgi:hypothetical protein